MFDRTLLSGMQHVCDCLSRDISSVVDKMDCPLKYRSSVTKHSSYYLHDKTIN